MCKHETFEPTAQFALASDDRTSLVVDVWCDTCGTSGSVIITSADVLWGDEEEDES